MFLGNGVLVEDFICLDECFFGNFLFFAKSSSQSDVFEAFVPNQSSLAGALRSTTILEIKLQAYVERQSLNWKPLVPPSLKSNKPMNTSLVHRPCYVFLSWQGKNLQVTYFLYMEIYSKCKKNDMEASLFGAIVEAQGLVCLPVGYLSCY